MASRTPFSSDDLTNPDYVFWNEQQDREWRYQVRLVLMKYQLNRREDRYAFCRALVPLLEQELRENLDRACWRGALHASHWLYQCILEQQERIESLRRYGFRHEASECEEALAEGLTLGGMRQRCCQSALQVLQAAPASDLGYLWKTAVRICKDHAPGDPFRGAVLGFAWPDSCRKALWQVLRKQDRKNFPDLADEASYSMDPEPPCPDYSASLMRGRSKDVREEDVLAEKRKESLTWLAWCQRNRTAAEYRAALEKMVLEAPWAQTEDLRTLRQCSTDAQWAQTREKLNTALYWEGRWEDAEGLSGETGNA